MKNFIFAVLILPFVCLAEEKTEFETSVKVDREGIRQTFVKKNKDILDCYTKIIKEPNNKDISGKLTLDILIGHQGEAVYVGMFYDKSTLKSHELAGCIQKHILNWTFPKPPQGQVVQLFYPLAFSPK